MERLRRAEVETLTRSVEDGKRVLAEAMAKHAAARKEAEADRVALLDVTRRLDAASSELDRAQARESKLQRELAKCESTVEELQANASQGGEAETLKAEEATWSEQASEDRAEAASKRAAANDADAAARAAEAELEPLAAAVAAAKSARDGAQKDAEDMEAEITGAVESYRPTVAKLAQANEALEQLAKEMEKRAQDLESKKKDAEAEKENALNVTDNEPMDVSESKHTAASANEEVRRLMQQLDEHKKVHAKNGESAEALLERAKTEAEDAEANLAKAKEEVERVTYRLKAVKRAMKTRAKRYENFREYACTKAAELFGKIMADKGHLGKLVFDHENGELRMEWIKDGVRKQADAAKVGAVVGGGAATQMDVEEEAVVAAASSEGAEGEKRAKLMVSHDTNSMSGGERSYATMALLMALSQTVRSPFAVMDEFDVFMDAASRRVAIEQLLRMARMASSSGVRRQMIFISPLDLAVVPNDPDVSKRVLQPPVEDFGAKGGGKRTSQSVLTSFGIQGTGGPAAAPVPAASSSSSS